MRSKHTRKDWVIRSCLGVAFVAAALSAAPSSVDAEETSFTIGTARDLQLGAQIGMAKHKGFFEEEGLDITVAYFGSGAEMTSAMERGVPQADGSRMVGPTFDVEKVAEAVLFIANLPLDTNVLFMNMMATKMPFVGRG